MSELKLNLGCSGCILPGWINVDCRKLPGVDKVCDLNVLPWPWPDASVDEIRMSHVLEHLRPDPVSILAECHRVLKPGGVITIVVPHGSGYLAFCPGHYHYFSRSWFITFENSCDSQFDLDKLWVKQSVKMSLLQWMIVPPLWFNCFRRAWEWFWNRSYGWQLAWEILGVLHPTEITWKATKN